MIIIIKDKLSEKLYKYSRVQTFETSLTYSAQ